MDLLRQLSAKYNYFVIPNTISEQFNTLTRPRKRPEREVFVWTIMYYGKECNQKQAHSV
jgi:hypothetical protein